jgi:antitoxin component of RelBE/YafQ-DinJ toxin-antitoxin module
MAQRKVAFVQMRLSAKEKARLEAVASQDGLTVSAFVRQLVRAAVDKKEAKR